MKVQTGRSVTRNRAREGRTPASSPKLRCSGQGRVCGREALGWPRCRQPCPRARRGVFLTHGSENLFKTRQVLTQGVLGEDAEPISRRGASPTRPSGVAATARRLCRSPVWGLLPVPLPCLCLSALPVLLPNSVTSPREGCSKGTCMCVKMTLVPGPPGILNCPAVHAQPVTVL